MYFTENEHDVEVKNGQTKCKTSRYTVVPIFISYRGFPQLSGFYTKNVFSRLLKKHLRKIYILLANHSFSRLFVDLPLRTASVCVLFFLGAAILVL